jgi:uncharacterized membrane protein YkoI
MSSRSRIALAVFLGLALCLALAVAGMAEKGEKEQKVTLDQLPAAVRATLENQAQGGTIDDIEVETKDGKVVYEADVVKNGATIKVKIAEDGTLISAKPKGKHCEGKKEKNEVPVTFDQLPPAVQATLRAQVGNGTLGDISRVTKHDKVFYEADVTNNGTTIEVKIAEDGTLIASKPEGKDEDHEGKGEEHEGADKD